MILLEVNNISKYESDNDVVNNISFTQLSRQKIAIAGETGSGKTTLLQMIAGLIQPSAGEIKFQNQKVTGPHEQLIPGHPSIAYMSQYFELRNNYRVHEVLEMSSKLPAEEAGKIYAVCQIEHLLKRRTNQLSGGEKQRIALARLLATTPKLLLLDEPFSNLDAAHKAVIKKVIQDIGEELNITSVMVSHDGLDVLSWADMILVMKDGEIIQQGTPREVYHQPVNEYCAGLFGEYNLIDAGNNAFLNAIKGVHIKGKQLLIRPEHISITSNPQNMVTGMVQNVLFWGSYYTVDVLIEKQVVRVKANANHFSSGDSIRLSFDMHKAWYV